MDVDPDPIFFWNTGPEILVQTCLAVYTINEKDSARWMRRIQERGNGANQKKNLGKFKNLKEREELDKKGWTFLEKFWDEICPPPCFTIFLKTFLALWQIDYFSKREKIRAQ